MIKQPVVRVDLRGFVHIDGVPVCKFDKDRHTLQFVDKDRRRSASRATGRYVEVGIDQLVNELREKAKP